MTIIPVAISRACAWQAQATYWLINRWLASQGLDAYDAAVAGAYIHARSRSVALKTSHDCVRFWRVMC